MPPVDTVWTPAAVLDLAMKLTQLVILIAAAWGIFRTKSEVQITKADVATANKQLDGRMSQMFDLVERLTAMIGRMGGAAVRSTDVRSRTEDPPAR